MENLIGGIQHFFVVTFTAVATAIIVALPFHKPPIHPTPSPKQEVQAKKEVMPSIIPSPTSQETQPVSKPSTIPIVIPPTTSVLVDCTGPDGKTIKLTQKQCDDFNTAWNKPPTNQNQNVNTNSRANNTNGYGNTSGNSSYNSNYPNYVFPTYPPINTGGSQQIPANTPVPVDHSLDLQICLNNAQNSYNSQMDDLNRRGMISSGQADQVKSQYASQQQSCRQQYGN